MKWQKSLSVLPLTEGALNATLVKLFQKATGMILKKKCSEQYLNHQFVNDKIDDALDEIKAHFIVLSKKSNDVTPEDVKKVKEGTKSRPTGGDVQNTVS